MGEDSLDRYRSMRDFRATPEPAGERPTPGPAGDRFVIQEHHATSLHWDLRLERGGVLVSWAVPKGIPPHPKQNHLAVHTEDHPLEYLDFEGDIPEGAYGAGGMAVWDRGTYETEKFDDHEVKVVFHGERVRGRYVLFHTDGNQWMIHRMDPPEDPSRELMPGSFAPMLATPGPLPAPDVDYSFEFWWPGERLTVAVEGGRPRATTPDGAEATSRWPELRELGLALGARAVALDGVMVTLGSDGRPDSARLRRRRNPRSQSAVRRLANQARGTYLLFDVLWFDGHGVQALPYRERRRLLEDLRLTGPSWQTAPAHEGAGHAVLAAATAQGLPGMVAKRLESPYAPGRSGDWIAVANPSAPA